MYRPDRQQAIRARSYRKATDLLGEIVDTSEDTVMTATDIVQPTLTEKEVIGRMPAGSKGHKQYVDHYDRAKDALKVADAAELFKLYEEAVKDRAKTETLLVGIAEHYCGSKDTPRMSESPPSESAVGSMERVALAAIDLAKQAFELRLPTGWKPLDEK